jgi:hypothetical protein
MYQVTKTKNVAGQKTTVWSYEFNEKNKAIIFLLEHASILSLDIREDMMYAFCEGNKPEMEIEITEINN